MANRYATKSGNESDDTVWDGGTPLAAGDTVRPNGYVVTLDRSLTVVELRNDASAPAVAGGSFTLSTGNITITADISLYHGVLGVTDNHATGTITINGNIRSKGTAGYPPVACYAKTGAGALAINGNIEAAHDYGGYQYCFQNQAGGTGTITVTGLIRNLVGGYCAVFYVAGGPVTVNFIGNQSHSTNNYGIYITGGTPTLNFTGSISSNGMSFLSIAAPATVNIVGNVSNSSSSTPAIWMYAAGGTTTITGNVTCSGAAPAIGFYATPAGTVTINGNITAGPACHAIMGNTYLAVTGPTLIANGNIVDSTNWHAITGFQKVYVHETNDLTHTYLSGLATRSLYTPGVSTGHPATSDTRYGTVYGPESELTGSLRVPPAGSVALGVPVDATVGSMDLVVDASSLGVVEANVVQIGGNTAAADNLAASTAAMQVGTVSTVSFTATTSQFEADDVTDPSGSHYRGRVVIFTSGNLFRQAGWIKAYVLSGGKGHFTLVHPVTEAPAHGDTFIIV